MRLNIDDSETAIRAGPAANNFTRIKLDIPESDTISTPGSLKRVKPPVPPPKSPRIFAPLISGNNNEGVGEGGVMVNNVKPGQHKAADISNFATQHIDEALRLLQESALNL